MSAAGSDSTGLSPGRLASGHAPAHASGPGDGESVFVGGDLSRVEVVPPDQVAGYQRGMIWVLCIALALGAVLAMALLA